MMKLLIPVLLLLCSQAWGAAAFVQGKDVIWFGGSGTTETLTLTTNFVAGDAIACLVGWSTTTATISTIKDGNNVSFGTPVDALTDGTAGKASTYVLPNEAGGVKTVVVTWSADPGFGTIVCHEASGVPTASVVDVHAINTQHSPGTGANAVTSTSVTTTGADYIFGATFDDQGQNDVWTAGPSFTGVGANTTFDYSERLIQSSGSAVAATFTTSLGVGAFTMTGIVALKPASGVVALKGFDKQRRYDQVDQ